jgi:hypothetical protein
LTPTLESQTEPTATKQEESSMQLDATAAAAPIAAAAAEDSSRPGKNRKTRRSGTANEALAAVPNSPTASPAPEAAAVVENVSPVLTPQTRGYVAQFHFDHYPYKPKLSTAANYRPLLTDPVTSIPMLFFRIISIFQELERDCRNRDILPYIDKKLLKLLGGSEENSLNSSLNSITPPHSEEATGGGAEDTNKYLLNDFDGNNYQVIACRKEHVRLLFEGPDGGMFLRLGICPQICDVFATNNGKKNILGGAGSSRVSRAESTAAQQAKNEIRCICNEDWSKFEPIRAHYPQPVNPSHNSIATIARLRSPRVKAEASHDIPTLDSSNLGQIGSNGNGGGLSREEDQLSDSIIDVDAGLDLSDVAIEHHSAIGEQERERWRRKIANQAKTISALNDEVRVLQAIAEDWQNRWAYEQDANIKLWDRVVFLQRTFRQMSRPITTNLALR